MRPHHTIGLLLSTVMVGGACSLFGGSPQQTAADQANVAAYGAQEQLCVSQAATLAAAQACVAQVQAAYGRPGGYLYEAGACVYEGGAPAPAAKPILAWPEAGASADAGGAQ